MSAVYVIAMLDFKDVARYRIYQSAFPVVFADSGGQVVAADESPVPLTGDATDKVVIMKFPDEETGRSFLESPDYRKISEDRDAGATVRSWMVRAL